MRFVGIGYDVFFLYMGFIFLYEFFLNGVIYDCLVIVIFVVGLDNMVIVMFSVNIFKEGNNCIEE